MSNESTNTLKLFADQAWVNPVEIGGEIRADVSIVRSWIDAGLLRAIDTSRPGSKKPRWKISEPIWLAFAAMQAAGAKPDQSPRRRRNQAADLSEFFGEAAQ